MKKLSKQEELALVRAIWNAVYPENGCGIVAALNENPSEVMFKSPTSKEDCGDWDESGLALHDKYDLVTNEYAFILGEGADGEYCTTVYLYPRPHKREIDHESTSDAVMTIRFDGTVTCRRDPEPWRDHRDNVPEYWYEFEPLTDEDIDNGKYKIEYEEEK